MPDLIDLIRKWWKQVLGVLVLSVAAVGTITYLKPREYLAVATSVPASAFTADKGKIFNENLQSLYSTLGTADDLDLIVGTGQLDTVYLAVADQFQLAEHYKVKEIGPEARTKIAYLLKRSSQVMKSGYGELKVKMWDTDKYKAAELANAIMACLQSIHQDIQSEGNKTILNGLRSGKEKILAETDSIKIFLSTATFPAGSDDPYTTRLNALNTQLSKYEKLIIEYELLLNSKPPVLITVEKAKPTLRPDRPRRLQVLIATAALSILFSVLLILVLERRKFTAN